MALCCCAKNIDDTIIAKKNSHIRHLQDAGLERGPTPRLRAREEAVPVTLNVYSLIEKNARLAKIGMGVYHSGVVVYGIEWSYGEVLDNPDESGLFCVHPGQAAGHLYKTIKVGHTTKSPAQVDTILHRLENEWRSSDYHILHNNCNNFSQSFLTMLSTIEKLEVPGWCNRAARVGDRLVPRRLATKIQRMCDEEPPKAKKVARKSKINDMPTSVIPRGWYLHPNIAQPPRYVHMYSPANEAADDRAERIINAKAHRRQGHPLGEHTHAEEQGDCAAAPPMPGYTAEESGAFVVEVAADLPADDRLPPALPLADDDPLGHGKDNSSPASGHLQFEVPATEPAVLFSAMDVYDGGGDLAGCSLSSQQVTASPLNGYASPPPLTSYEMDDPSEGSRTAHKRRQEKQSKTRHSKSKSKRENPEPATSTSTEDISSRQASEAYVTAVTLNTSETFQSPHDRPQHNRHNGRSFDVNFRSQGTHGMGSNATSAGLGVSQDDAFGLHDNNTAATRDPSPADAASGDGGLLRASGGLVSPTGYESDVEGTASAATDARRVLRRTERSPWKDGHDAVTVVTDLSADGENGSSQEGSARDVTLFRVNNVSLSTAALAAADEEPLSKTATPASTTHRSVFRARPESKSGDDDATVVVEEAASGKLSSTVSPNSNGIEDSGPTPSEHAAAAASPGTASSSTQLFSLPLPCALPLLGFSRPMTAVSVAPSRRSAHTFTASPPSRSIPSFSDLGPSRAMTDAGALGTVASRSQSILSPALASSASQRTVASAHMSPMEGTLTSGGGGAASPSSASAPSSKVHTQFLPVLAESSPQTPASVLEAEPVVPMTALDSSTTSSTCSAPLIVESTSLIPAAPGGPSLLTTHRPHTLALLPQPPLHFDPSGVLTVGSATLPLGHIGSVAVSPGPARLSVSGTLQEVAEPALSDPESSSDNVHAV